ncbi:hypothetical protein Q7C_649 [Methylophaga frappieri]|uniref:IrrE N-terminal-like domain-containing protein n=1 Tax=Methylophaga frappieri (strain ATCC BAA-2434 / DSM 25690 / JAM7) TaxID=754477 RepID=I1YFX7_METFJ|nr:hypothetical protein [Methylophaga frappieri]AFJ01820.1 hypothetical protein Q7C_649 [Methylophaga frappieri]
MSSLRNLLKRYGLEVIPVEDDRPIPGSFFGDSEAGLIGDQLFVRPDTPIHSALHEAGHFICMDNSRRQQLNTDAAGDYDEENGVCYLQILLSDYVSGMGRDRMMQDMDSWGYSFRLGSARAWFEQDAEDAHQWLRDHQLIDTNSQPTFLLRQQ